MSTSLWEVLGVPGSFTGLMAAGATATDTGGEPAEAAGEKATEVAAVGWDAAAEAATEVQGMLLVWFGFSPTGMSFPAKGRITSGVAVAAA